MNWNLRNRNSPARRRVCRAYRRAFAQLDEMLLPYADSKIPTMTVLLRLHARVCGHSPDESRETRRKGE